MFKRIPGSVMGESLQINMVAISSKAINAFPVAVKLIALTELETGTSYFIFSATFKSPI